MNGSSVKHELVGLEKEYWQAIKDKDADAAMRLSDDSCIITGAQGVGKVDKQTLAKMMKSASYTRCIPNHSKGIHSGETGGRARNRHY